MPVHFAPLEVTLRDGRRLALREAQPGDAGAFRAAWARLSDESRYARFMSPLREPTAQMLQRAVAPDAGNEFQLIAVSGAEIAGGARFVALPGHKDCEFAVTVVDAWQGKGLARTLMQALMRVARERGYERMEGYILASNAAMLALARKLGFVSVPNPDDPGVRVMRCNLDSTSH